MNRIWLISKLSISLFILSITFWYNYSQWSNDNDWKWDCDLVAFSWKDFWDRINQRKYENIYPKEWLKRAILNLKAYCCKNNLVWKNYCESNWLMLDSYPESKFLYDHLIDIWLRRLDAKENLMYKWIDSNIELDKAWKERRKFITDKAESKDWTTATDLLPKIKEQRILSQLSWSKLPKRENWNYKENYENERKVFATNYDNIPLINRYSNACEISAYLYFQIWWNLWIETIDWYNKCKNLTDNIIRRNIIQIKAIILKKSNKLLYDSIDSFISNYFSQNRLVKLKETILWIVQAFNSVNKKIVELVEKCS